ncbi:MAG: hypothetical protein LBR68_02165 [Lachnoclostridium sp.]|jgi:hypothetical protein|nr:hypothetical protein [Lachnoclostridium sp.]
MENLTASSVTDLRKLKTWDLHHYLSQAASILATLENHISFFNSEKARIEHFYNSSESEPKLIIIARNLGWSVVTGGALFAMSLLITYTFNTIGVKQDNTEEFNADIAFSDDNMNIAVAVGIVSAILCYLFAVYITSRGKIRINELIEKNKQSMYEFEKELSNSENIIAMIPDKYRMSIILYKFCEYLADGEASTWERCIEVFKEDVHRSNMEESMNQVINNLDAIESNTRATMLFAGISAWNSFRR